MSETEKKRGLSGSAIKIIAIVAMLIDHIGAVFFPQYRVLRCIGRIAFPIYAYCLAAGCIYTHDMRRYVLRLFVLSLLAQPIYVTAMGHQSMLSYNWALYGFRPERLLAHYFCKPSILYTLLAGALLIWTIRDKKYILTLLVFAAVWYLQGKLDYGLNGVLLMLLFYVFIDRPAVSFVWVAAFMLWWGLPGFQNAIVPGTSFSPNTQFYALLALPFIYAPFNTGTRINKYVFYAFYPAHLLGIYLARMLLK